MDPVEELVGTLGLLGLALWFDGVFWWVVDFISCKRRGCGLTVWDAAADANVELPAGRRCW